MSVWQAPVSMGEYAATALRDQIVSGRLAVGARLEQRKLADELGVSVIPVREALRQLEAEGIVTVRARHGAFVATCSREQLRELSLLRQVLDPLATRHGAGRMSDATLARLDELLAAAERHAERGDVGAVSRTDREFHLAIYAEAGMPILLQTITGLRDRYAMYSRLCLDMPGYAERSLREHRQILDACRARDAELAAERMRAHLEFALEALLERLPAVDGEEAGTSRG